MRVTGQQIVNQALEMFDGLPYIYGYEVKLGDPSPKAGDCSEMVQATCYILGVEPQMPDGAIYQLQHCQEHSTDISIDDAIKTPGALLFHIGGSRHVAISQGNGLTIECRGRNYGCGQFDVYRKWTHGALIPGVEYPGWEG